MGPGWNLDDYGPLDAYAINQVGARQACCACGGGSTRRVAPAENGCVDATGPWADTEGDGCDAYAANSWCTTLGGQGPGWDGESGPLRDYADHGKDATQACCACGGGQPYKPADAQCRDVHGWTDMEGDACEDYAREQYCTEIGQLGPGWKQGEWGLLSDYAVDGKDATKACCACGGGEAGTECWDKKGWLDPEGDSCGVYVGARSQLPQAAVPGRVTGAKVAGGTGKPPHAHAAKGAIWDPRRPTLGRRRGLWAVAEKMFGARDPGGRRLVSLRWPGTARTAASAPAGRRSGATSRTSPSAACRPPMRAAPAAAASLRSPCRATARTTQAGATWRTKTAPPTTPSRPADTAYTPRGACWEGNAATLGVVF